MEYFLKCLVWLVQFKKKRRGKSKFSWLALLFKHFVMKIQSNMSEQGKKWQWLYDLLNADTKLKKIIGVSLWPPPLDYFILGVLENKTNETSHSNTGSLKTAIEEEWNKMSD